MSTLNSTILNVTRRTTKGFTVGEIFDRIQSRAVEAGSKVPNYSTVRARVYELANSGKLATGATRKDSVSGRTATTYRHR